MVLFHFYDHVSECFVAPVSMISHPWLLSFRCWMLKKWIWNDLDISKVLDEFLTPKMDDFLEKYEDVIRFLI